MEMIRAWQQLSPPGGVPCFKGSWLRASNEAGKAARQTRQQERHRNQGSSSRPKGRQQQAGEREEQER